MEVSLHALPPGAGAVVKRLEGGEEFVRKLASLNIRIGKVIKKVADQPFGGPVVVAVENTRATIGMKMAQKIFVEPEPS